MNRTLRSTMSGTRVRVVAPGDDPPQIQDSRELERLVSTCDLTVYRDRPETLDEKLLRVKDAEIILNSRPAVAWPAEALRQLPNLRMICIGGVGTDNIDLKTAEKLGIVVCNQPGVSAPMVAEHALALAFATAKRVAYQTNEIKNGHWIRKDNILLHGKTMGIVGTGHVGSELARLANAVGMRVLAWTFHPSAYRAKLIRVKYVELDYLLRESDVVSLHLKLSNQSRGIIGVSELRAMKSGAILVNTGRGELVDNTALAEALNNGNLGGAGLDVFEQEPLSADSPLSFCEQVVFTPHQGDRTVEGRQQLNISLVDSVLAFLNGHPKNIVRPQ